MPAFLVGNWWGWKTGEQQAWEKEEREKTEKEGTQLLLQIYTGKKQEEMELETYLAGVVAAEMPAAFHLEALKAQAVAARTYALQKRKASGGSGCKTHPGADLCTESTCCQAWEDETSLQAKWPPEKASFYRQRIQEAVDATRGMIITYEGRPIEAVYHSTCGGATETAAALWSGNEEAVYLQSVECTYCQHSPYFKKEIEMEAATYAAALRSKVGVLPVLGKGGLPLMTVKQYSSSGRNLVLSIGSPGRLYSGNEVRSLLGLPSTFFQWRTEKGKIIFLTRGHGHGVGLCQYGADGLGLLGKNFREILQYYYRGVEVEKWTGSGH